MTINEIQDEIIEEFSEIEDWMDRYQLIIDLGEEGDVLPAGEKNETNLIDGCQSRVWIVCDQNPDGTLTFRGESDASSSKVSFASCCAWSTATPPRKFAMPTSILFRKSVWPKTFRRRVPTDCSP